MLDIATKKRQYFWSIGLYTKKAGFNDRFSGTRDGIQLFYEIYRTVSTPKVRSPIGGLVSKYFYNAYCAINRWDRLGITIKYLLWRYPDYKVWVTGHSLGRSSIWVHSAAVWVHSAAVSHPPPPLSEFQFM